MELELELEMEMEWNGKRVLFKACTVVDTKSHVAPVHLPQCLRLFLYYEQHVRNLCAFQSRNLLP